MAIPTKGVQGLQGPVGPQGSPGVSGATFAVAPGFAPPDAGEPKHTIAIGPDLPRLMTREEFRKGEAEVVRLLKEEGFAGDVDRALQRFYQACNAEDAFGGSKGLEDVCKRLGADGMRFTYDFDADQYLLVGRDEEILLSRLPKSAEDLFDLAQAGRAEQAREALRGALEASRS